jgi:hypothetical protein
MAGSVPLGWIAALIAMQHVSGAVRSTSGDPRISHESRIVNSLTTGQGGPRLDTAGIAYPHARVLIVRIPDEPGTLGDVFVMSQAGGQNAPTIRARATFRPWTSNVKPPRRWRVVAGDQPTFGRSQLLAPATAARDDPVDLLDAAPPRPTQACWTCATRSPDAVPAESGHTGGAASDLRGGRLYDRVPPVPDGPGWWQLDRSGIQLTVNPLR